MISDHIWHIVKAMPHAHRLGNNESWGGTWKAWKVPECWNNCLEILGIQPIEILGPWKSLAVSPIWQDSLAWPSSGPHKIWNGIVKNISGIPVTQTEQNLFSKGQKFCPVEKDPPIVRMQAELNRFFRMLRIKWLFDDKPDSRTELEKEFYENSSWEPPKAGKEIEEFIKDNLTNQSLLTFF